MAGEIGEIILKTQGDSEADEATSPTACSGASMDDILQALHSLGKQNNEIENKMEQQRLKIESLVQEISQLFEEFCRRVHAQATHLENGLKIHEDKLTVRKNALEEEFTRKVNSLDSKQSLLEEDVKERLKETQESFNSRLDKALKSLADKLDASPVAEHSMQVKVETSTPLKSGLQPETSTFSSPFSVCSGDPEHKRPVQQPPSFNGKSQWESYIAPFEIVAGMNQRNDQQKGNYLATSLKGPALSLLGNLSPRTGQDYKELQL